jgi:thermitase
MKRITGIGTLIFVLALASSSALAQNSTSVQLDQDTLSKIRPGHLLVRFKSPAAEAALSELPSAFGVKTIGKLTEIGVTRIQVLPQHGLAALQKLRKSSEVEFAEFDYKVQASMEPSDSYYDTAYATSKFGSISQWGPQAVSAPSAWDLTSGNRSIVIAVVDTGIDSSHPDLASKVVSEYSYVGRSAKDDFGHGTHVAGIAAAATNNNAGIAGMCPNCGILSIKALDSQGSGYMSDVASAITYAASHGARVINLSLGGNGRSETLRLALQYAVANNALPVCAAGNSNSGTNTPEPAFWYECLTVIASDESGARASFSNYGVKADVAAPGHAILSTMPTSAVTLNSKYGYYTQYDALNGTSMATPMVAGIAGLVLSRNPNLTPAQVKGLIVATSGDGTTWRQDLGFGMVNATKAVAAAVRSDYTAASTNLLSPTNGSTVSGMVDIQAAPSDNSGVHHIDIVRDGSRFLQPLVGVATSSGKGRTAVTNSAWSVAWPSTSVFNGTVTLAAVSTDSFGNPSVAQPRMLTVQNRLVTQSWTQHLCWPNRTNCPVTTWVPVTTGVATEAATRLQGTVIYTSQKNIRSSIFWLKVASPGFGFNCGSFGNSIDCYPSLTLKPDTSRSYVNHSGAQLDGTAGNNNPASEEADIQWTLTYPQ